jgi:uncharacterized protein (DUF885 family)
MSPRYISKLKRFAVVIILITSCQSKEESVNGSVNLADILNNYAHDFYALNPLAATANGINDYNDQLEIDLSKQYRTQAIALNTKYLDTLNTLNYDRLTNSEKISVGVLRYTLQIENERLENDYGAYRPVDQFVFSFPQRFAVLGAGSGFIPFNNEQDYRNFMSRMKAFQQWVEIAITKMQMGMVLGNTNPRASMEKVPQQLRPLFEASRDKNIFYKPLLNLPTDIADSTRKILTRDYA